MAGGIASTKQKRMLYGIAKKHGMDNDMLHARCKAVTGQESISKLTVGQCARLIDSIEGKKSDYQPQAHRPIDRASQEQIGVIFGLCKKLGWIMGGMVDKLRLKAFLKKRFGIEAIDWMTPEQAIKVTEALKAMLAGGRGEREGYTKAE